MENRGLEMERYKLVHVDTYGEIYVCTENNISKLLDLIHEVKIDGDWLHLTIINVEEGLIFCNEVNYEKLDA